MSSDVLEFGLMKTCLSLSLICAKEAQEVNSPGSRLTLIQHAIGFLNLACQLKPSIVGPFAGRCIAK
ncbi:MAG: hypothetical protein GX338_00655 [Firmicutes bacterium]|nr:hypothetical protein [Bacillota bacterium]